MRTNLFFTKAAGLVAVALMSAACASAPDAHQEAPRPDTETVEVSAGRFSAMRDLAQQIDATAQALDAASRSSLLDTELQSSWIAARATLVKPSVLATVPAQGSGTTVSEAAISELSARLDAFLPIYDQLDDRAASLPPSLQTAYEQVSASMATFDAIEETVSTPLVVEKGLRKKRCCMTYRREENPLDGHLQDVLDKCTTLTATKVGAAIACAGITVTRGLTASSTVRNGRCSAQEECNRL